MRYHRKNRPEGTNQNPPEGQTMEHLPMRHYLLPLALVFSFSYKTPSGGKIKAKHHTTDSGVTVATFYGQFDDVEKFVDAQAFNPAAFIADGDNAMALNDDDDVSMLMRQFVVITATPDGKTLSEAKAGITKDEFGMYKRRGLNFGSFIAIMDSEVNLAGWSEGYTGKWAKYATTARFDFYIETDTESGGRTIKGSTTDVTTMILMGDDSKRTLIGQISGTNECKVLNGNHDDVQTRHTVTGQYVLEFVSGSDTVNGITADQIVGHLTGRIDDLGWAQTKVDANIVELSANIGDQNTVIATMANGDYRYIPYRAVIHGGNLNLIPSTANGVKFTDFGDDKIGAPIARANIDGDLIATVDNNGTAELIKFTDIRMGTDKPWGQTVERMINAAATGSLAA
jgi:hypothetical protein